MSLTGDPIIILGMFRGGTSCLSTALAALGLHLGNEGDFQAANEFNEGGYWELEEMQALNLKALFMFGMNALGADRLPENWRDLPGALHMVDEIAALLERHFAGHAHWGWKEPGTTDLLPLYKEALASASITAPRYAISVRHPLSVASSRKRQFQMKTAKAGDSESKGKLPPDEQRTVGIWVHYMLTTLRETKGFQRQMISYESFLRDPKAHLERLAGLLPWKPTQAQMDAAVATIKPSWSHSRFNREDLDDWPSIVGRTYDLCLLAAEDVEGLNEGKYDSAVDDLWQEWRTLGNMVRSSQLPAGQMIFSWRDGSEMRHSAHEFTPNGDWQRISAQIKAPPGETIQINPYQMACQIWLKSVVWKVDGQRQGAALMPGPTGIMEDLGMLRLTAFGPAAMMTKAPTSGNSTELEIEFLLQFDLTVLNAAVYMLRDRLDQAKRSMSQQQPSGQR
jgi:hypothetical protein